MTRTALLSASFAAMLVLAFPSIAQAGNDVSFAAQSGTDTSNTCGDPTHPCRTLVNAFVNTNAGGTVICSSGSYESFFYIVKSITFDCNGGVIDSVGITISSDTAVV